MPSDENGKFYNPANPPQTTPSTTITTTTTTRARPRNDVIDRGVIDRGVIVRPPNIVISREDPDESYRDQNYQNVSTKGKSKTWAHSLTTRSRTNFLFATLSLRLSSPNLIFNQDMFPFPYKAYNVRMQLTMKLIIGLFLEFSLLSVKISLLRSFRSSLLPLINVCVPPRGC